MPVGEDNSFSYSFNAIIQTFFISKTNRVNLAKKKKKSKSAEAERNPKRKKCFIPFTHEKQIGTNQNSGAKLW